MKLANDNDVTFLSDKEAEPKSQWIVCLSDVHVDLTSLLTAIISTAKAVSPTSAKPPSSTHPSSSALLQDRDPTNVCHKNISKELIKKFDLRLVESQIPNPTHCFDCRELIRPQEISEGIGECVFYHKKTCASYKRQEHTGLYLENPHVQLLFDKAEQDKWQVCEKCGNLTERVDGCFHMLYASLLVPRYPSKSNF